MNGKKKGEEAGKDKSSKERRELLKYLIELLYNSSAFMCSISASFLGKQQCLSFLLALWQLLLLTKGFTNQSRLSQLFNNSKGWENIAREGQHFSILARSLVSKTKCELLRDNSPWRVIPLGTAVAHAISPVQTNANEEDISEKMLKTHFFETSILLDFYILILSLEQLVQPGIQEARAGYE